VKKAATKKLTEGDVAKAARHGAWPTIARALAEGLNPNSVQIYGQPLLSVVAAEAPLKIVAATLKAGADANAENLRRETSLFFATDPRIVRALLKGGANPNHLSRLGDAPLHVFATAGHAAAIGAMLESGVDVEIRTEDGQTPLALAVQNLRMTAVEVLLSHKANPNVAGKKSDTLLHVACRQRTQSAVKIVNMLITAGADLEARTHEHLTPLMEAATVEAPEALLRAGANVNAATPLNETGLMRAVYRGDVGLARLLLRAKAESSVAAHRRRA
jgi:ankyrin